MTNQLLSNVASVARKPAIQTSAAMACLPMTAAGMRAIGLSADVDTATLADGLLDGRLWIALGMAAAFGAFGGIVAEMLSLRGHVEMPHRARVSTRGARRSRLGDPRYEVDLGIFSRLLLGAAAGLALLAVFTPTSPTSLIVNALIAGLASTGVLRLLQRSMMAKAQAQTAPASHTPSPDRDDAAATNRQLAVVPETQAAAA